MGELVQDWFAVSEPEPGVVAITEPLHEENVTSYLVLGQERALLIDTSLGVGDIGAVVRSLADLPVLVVNSHAHLDHIGGNRHFPEVWIHAAEADALTRPVPNERLRDWFGPARLRGPLPPSIAAADLAVPARPADRLLHDGETIDLGGRRIEVIQAPGHSPGGIVLLDRAAGILFSTDAAYPGALYCFNPDSSLADYRRTMAKLAELAPTLRAVYPSHNACPMDPALLPRMRDALDAVAAGRRPDEVADGRATHRFAGFSVVVPAANGAGRR